MLEDGIYGLDYRAQDARGEDGGRALAILRDGKILGSDPWGGLFTGLYDYDPRDCLNKVRLRFDVPPQRRPCDRILRWPKRRNTGYRRHIRTDRAKDGNGGGRMRHPR
jgi:hypothetical protein